MPKKPDLLEEKELIQDEETVEVFEDFQDIEEEMNRDGEELVFENGPTYNLLEDWKSRFDGEIYFSDFENDAFVWRPIRRQEFRDIQRSEGTKDEFYVEEAVCRTCVLWPEDYAMHKITFGKAGIPTTLSQLIMERSGFLRPATMKL